VKPDANQIQLSASSRGITDHFFCFTCDEYVWDCDHLIEERLAAPRMAALEGSELQFFAYDGKSRVLEIEFRVTPPFIHSEVRLPPPPKVIQYFNVPRYVFTKLTRSKTARMQERYWEDHIRTRYKCQTVRTVCRLPRVWRFSEVRNVRRYSFEQYLSRMSVEEQQAMPIVVAAIKGSDDTHACTKTRGRTRRFIGVPMLRKCGNNIPDDQAPELSVDGSSVATCRQRYKLESALLVQIRV